MRSTHQAEDRRQSLRISAAAGTAALLAAVGLPLGAPAAHADTPSCSALGVTVSALHGPRFYTDLSVSPQLRGAYAGYRLTDTSGTERKDLWVRLGSFTGGSVGLGSGQAASQQIATLGSGAGVSRFWYLTAAALSSTTQQHELTVWQGRPDLPGSEVLCGTVGGFSSVDSTIKAAANKLTSVSVSSDAPKLGSTFTVTVKGSTGTIGAGTTDDPSSFWMSPSALSSWPAEAFRLVGTSVAFDGGDPLLDTLRVRDLTSPDKDYTAVYTFRAIGFTSAATGVYPVQQIASGTQIKHTDMTSTANLPAIAPATNDLQLSGSIDPADVPPTGGVAHVSVDVSGTTGAVLDDFVAQLPDGVAVVPGSVTWNGTSVPDPVAGTEGLVLQGPWTLTGDDRLELDLELPADPGDHAVEVVGHVGLTQIDTTLATDDDQPVRLMGNVNSAPVAVDDEASVDVGASVVVPVLDNDSDPDDDVLDIAEVSTPAYGTVTTDGQTVTYTAPTPHPEGWDGQESVSYTVSDGRGGTDSADLVLTVTAPPPATAHQDEVEATAGEVLEIDVLGNDRGSGLRIVDVVGPSGLDARISEDEQRIELTAPAQPGEYTLTYTVVDDDGETSQATVTVTVSGPGGPDPAPFSALPDLATTTAGGTVDIDVLANDQGDGLELQAVTGPAHGTASIEAGKVRYTPASDFVGDDELTYTVADAHGQVLTVQVAVTVDAGPSGVDDLATTSWDTAVVVDVLANDPDGSRVAEVVDPSAHGQLMLVDSGIRYDPDTTFAGEDSFTYRLVGSRSPTTVSVDVAGPQLETTDDEVSTTRTAPPVELDVLANDSGTDLEVVSWTEPSHGTMTEQDGILTYTPAADFTGVDELSYTVRDVVGDTASGSVRVTVVNAAPTLSGWAVRDLAAGQTVLLPLHASDEDLDHLSFEVGAVRGSVGDWPAADLVEAEVRPGADGQVLRVVLDPAFTGRAAIPVEVHDGHGGSDRRVARLVVRPRPAVGVDASVVADPRARAAVRHPRFGPRGPVSRVLATGVDSRIQWRQSPTQSVRAYVVTVAGEPVCEVAATRAPRQSCLVTATTVRPGVPVEVTAVGVDGLRSATAGVPVSRPRHDVLLAVVYFPSGEFVLDGAARRVLDRVSRRAASGGYDAVYMSGHTDSDGAARFNQRLSVNRAGRVADYLSGRTRTLDVGASVGFGEARPAMPGTSVLHKAANRRVEVLVSMRGR